MQYYFYVIPVMGSNEEKNCLVCNDILINNGTWGYCFSCWNSNKVMKKVTWEKYWMNNDASTKVFISRPCITTNTGRRIKRRYDGH